MSQRNENDSYDTNRENHRRSGGGAGWIFIVIGLLLVIGPLVASAFFTLGTLAQLILVGLGALTLLVGGIIVIISNLYVTATTDRGFVRTGMGGKVVVVDGGAIVIPAVHQLTTVSLETMRMEVSRKGEDALLTSDSLRADIAAEFFLRVQKELDDVATAAQSIGGGDVTRARAQLVLQDKLVSALRSTALEHTLVELNKDRTKYVNAVQKILGEDLKKNGFTLETVTISYLDQTPMRSMNADSNIFDAEGAKKVAEIVAARRVERNEIERSSEEAVALRNVATRKKILATEQDQQLAEAEQANQIAQARALAEASARSQAAEQSRLAGVAEATSQQAVQIAGVTRQKAVEVAEQERRQASETARVTAEQAIEVASREREVAVANAEAQRAAAQQTQLEAEAARETADQAVKTVAARAEATRRGEIEVIAQRAVSDKEKTRITVAAEADAASRVTLANAERTAAEASAAARVTAANADRDAQVASAEGQKAVAMVPVEVQRATVAVERDDLAQKAEFESISSGLTTALANIAADKDVRVAMANAMGTAMSAAKITLWGTPDQLQKMTSAFMNGQAVGQAIQGFEAGAPADVVDKTKDAISGLGTLAAAALKRLTGTDIPADTIEAVLREEQGRASANGATKR